MRIVRSIPTSLSWTAALLGWRSVASSSVVAFAPPAASRSHVAVSTMLEISSSNEMDRRTAFDEAAKATSVVFTAATFTTGLLLPQPASASSSSPSPPFPTWTLDGDVLFPTLALNTVGLSTSDAARAVHLATTAGFTHVDFHPGKERDGVALYLATNPKSNLFLNTKIRKPPPGTSAKTAAELTRSQISDDLLALNVPRVDMLMLRDSPDCSVMQAQWAELEHALRAGKTRAIGVINYCEGSLKCLLETAEIRPALNYYLVHAGMAQNPTYRSLRKFCDDQGIRTFAYGAVGEPGPNADIWDSNTLRRIGKRNGGRAAEEVALRWIIQGGAACSVRPTLDFGLGRSVCSEEGKATCAAGLAARASVFDWELSERDMAEIDAMVGPDDNPTLFSSSGCPDAFVMPK